MKASFAVLVAVVAGIAGAAAANPKNYNYQHCARRYDFGLEMRHRQLHREAVQRDERNHVENRNHEKRLRERHGHLRARLAADHDLLGRREAEFRRARMRRPGFRPVARPPVAPPPGPAPAPRPVLRPAERPAAAPPPPPAPTPRSLPRDRDDHPGRARGHEKENPGLHRGHHKDDDHPGNARGHGDENPGKGKGRGDDNPGKGKDKKR